MSAASAGGHRRAGSGPRGPRLGLIWGARVISVLLAVTILVGFGWGWHTYRQFNQSLTRLDIIAPAQQQPGHKDIDGKDQNLLIVGNDDRSDATDAELSALGTTKDGGSLNTDTLMIVHIPADGRSATLISIPRDSYVSIPGYGMDKINAAYPDAYNAAVGSENAKRQAGASLLVKTIGQLTGLTIDHYLQVDLLGFYRISNAVDGIWVNMCAAVQDPESGIDLPKGRTRIQGKQALAFVRQRYNFPNGLGDLDRVERQRYFLTAGFRQLSAAGIFTHLSSLLNAVKNSIVVDDKIDLISLAAQLENLSADNIAGQTIPFVQFQDVQLHGGTASVEIVDPVAVKAFVAKLLGTSDPALAKAKAIAPAKVTVDVVNASGQNGVARQNAITLRRDGFVVADYTQPSAGPSTATLIEYSAGMQAQAKTLAAYVPGANYQLTPGLTHVTLLLGSDGLAAKYVVPSTPASTAAGSPKPTSTTPAPKAIDAGCIN